jgi:MarR family transcriptional regulator, organic hydroperoxide resistance regulator
MSISNARGKNGHRRRRGNAALPREVKSTSFRLPATVSRPTLLEQGSDERFRRLVYDLLTVATRMTVVREHLGRRMGISAPQYSLLMAIGQLQGELGVGVTAVARVLHVSSAFVATETGKLAQAGVLTKRANPKDRRAVLLSLTRAGRALIERNSAEVRAINDIFFGALTATTFAAASAAMAALVGGSARATAHLNRLELGSWREAAE